MHMEKQSRVRSGVAHNPSVDVVAQRPDGLASQLIAVRECEQKTPQNKRLH